MPSGGPLRPCPCVTSVPSPPLRWAFLELHTNGHYNDSLQAYAAGVVEAAVSEEVRPDGDPGAPASPTPHLRVPRELRRAPRSVQSGLPAPASVWPERQAHVHSLNVSTRLHSMHIKNT